MKIGILGTGMVGKTLGTKLAQLGHEVKMGSREAGNKEGAAWAKSAGKGASEGTFADAAKLWRNGVCVFARRCGAAGS